MTGLLHSSEERNSGEKKNRWMWNQIKVRRSCCEKRKKNGGEWYKKKQENIEGGGGKRLPGCSRRSNFQNGSSSIKQVLLLLLQREKPANPSQNAQRMPFPRLERTFPFIFSFCASGSRSSILDPENPSSFARLNSILCLLLPSSLSPFAMTQTS